MSEVKGFWYGTSNKDENGRKHVLLYKVESATPLTPFSVFGLSGLPAIYSLHPDDAAARCVDIEPVMLEDPYHWEVRCTYRFAYTSFSSGEDEDDPTRLPAEISVGDEEMDRPILRAYRVSQFGTVSNWGKPKVAVTNSIGDPFDPPYAGPVPLTRISITKNYRELDLILFKRLQGSMNAVDITVAGYDIKAREGRVKFTYENLWDVDGHVYFRVSYNILINPETWVTELVNFSRNKYVGGKKTPITNKDRGDTASAKWLQDSPVSEPVLINVDGTVNTGNSSDIDAPTVSYYTTWAEDWTALGLPAEPEDRRGN
jgi:hypothetical protein